MDTEQTPAPQAQHTGWGAPPAPEPRQAQGRPPRRWSARKVAVAAVVAVGIAGAGTAVVYAANGSAGTGTQQGPGGQGGGMPGGGSGGGPGGAGALSAALHGEYVVSDGDGGYATELMQNGEVTEISSTSITATSEDGYTKTYTIDADTLVANGSADIGDIGTGDDVTIVATLSGDTATADSLSEAGTTTGQGPMGRLPPDQNGQNGQTDTAPTQSS
jgi:hypothetical protein